MAEQLVKVRDLTVNVEEKEILHGIDLDINKGETHVLLGPNGAGKSTLGYALMGHPKYEVTGGSIVFDGKELSEESPAERAKAGMYLSFQNPIEVPGITLGNFIRSAMEQRTGSRIRLRDFNRELKRVLEILQMDGEYARRDLNVGFSGGEKKKAEILQLLMLKPSFAILDETDSGLDVDAVHTVSLGIEEYLKNENGSLLIITHSARILESLQVDATHVLVDGRIVENGDASLVDEINETGFKKYLASEKAE